MKNICFLIGSLNSSGGTERVTSLIANALDKNKYNIIILSLFNGKDPFFKLNENISFYELNDKKISMKANYFSTILKIRKFMKRHDINTLIVVDSISCIFTVPALWGLNHINHICWEHFNFNVDLGVYFRRLGRQWAAKYCDYVVTLTKRDKTLWEQGLTRINAKILSVLNPTPFSNTNNIPRLENKVILAIGHLVYVKGFDRLLDAWSKVCLENPKWLLIIVGSGDEEFFLKKQATELNLNSNIQFAPATKNIEEYYRKATYVCLSSRSEGLPMVLLEAQSFGLPLIAFDCVTGPSDIIIDKWNGILVEDGNINELSNKLLELMSYDQDLYHSIVENSYVNSERFTIDKIINQWENII